MPKFIMYSGHSTVISSVDVFFNHLNLKGDFRSVKSSAMYMFNFFECLSCEADERFVIELTLYPHETYDDESSQQIFRMSTADFIKTMEDAIDDYVEKFELTSSDLNEICE